MDEFEALRVILADREKARFFLSYLGEVAEYDIKVPGRGISQASRRRVGREGFQF